MDTPKPGGIDMATTITDPTTTGDDYLDPDANPDAMVETVDQLKLLGAAVMVGTYPNDAKQIQIAPATASTPGAAALDASLLHHPPQDTHQ